MTHNHCAHDFRYCATCDVVWCGKCSKEWGVHAHADYIYVRPAWQTTPVYPSYPWLTQYPTTGGTMTLDDSVTVSATDHSLCNKV